MAGSACSVPLREDNRGAAIAFSSDRPRSRYSVSTCVTVVMMVAPPGDPRASTGRPCSVTIVGLIDERGRLPGPGRFGSGTPAVSGTKLKSVSSLLSRNPQPGTVIAEPPVCSMVSVYAATLPQRSATVRCVVPWSSRAASWWVAPAEHEDGPSGLPNGNGRGAATVGLNSAQARSFANACEVSCLVGTPGT